MPNTNLPHGVLHLEYPHFTLHNSDPDLEFLLETFKMAIFSPPPRCDIAELFLTKIPQFILTIPENWIDEFYDDLVNIFNSKYKCFIKLYLSYVHFDDLHRLYLRCKSDNQLAQYVYESVCTEAKLCISITNKNYKAVSEILLSDPNILYNKLYTDIAASVNDPSILCLVVEYFSRECNDTKKLYEQSVSTAVESDSNNVIEYLLMIGVCEINMIAKLTTGSNLNIIRFILEQGFDVNFCNGKFLTDAVTSKNVALVQLLLDRGADSNISSGLPLVIAVKNHYDDIVVLLMLNGANPNMIKKHGITISEKFCTPKMLKILTGTFFAED